VILQQEGALFLTLRGIEKRRVRYFSAIPPLKIRGGRWGYEDCGVERRFRK
jgi:hypothetical protein